MQLIPAAVTQLTPARGLRRGEVMLMMAGARLQEADRKLTGSTSVSRILRSGLRIYVRLEIRYCMKSPPEAV